jgi:hypothetical protein
MTNYHPHLAIRQVSIAAWLRKDSPFPDYHIPVVDDFVTVDNLLVSLGHRNAAVSSGIDGHLKLVSFIPFVDETVQRVDSPRLLPDGAENLPVLSGNAGT